MLEALSAAARFFRGALENDQRALSYLSQRQIDTESAEKFGVGFAPPGWDGLAGFLNKEKVNLASAAKAGLVGRRQDGGYYDRFRNRLMFPVKDPGDRIVGFGGRDLGTEGPKYLNSPETAVFRKGDILYGFGLARKAISMRGHAVLVEGYLDVVSAHRAGLENTVAAMGTAFGDGLINLLKRVSERAVLCFDSDSAGERAANVASESLEQAGFDVRVARLPAGEDPDSLVISGRGGDLVRAVEDSVPATEYRLDQVLAEHNLNDEAERSRMLVKAAAVVARTPNIFERDRLIRKLAPFHPGFNQGTDVAEARIRGEVDRLAKVKTAHSERLAGQLVGNKAPEAKRLSAVEKAEHVLLRSLLDNDEFAEYIAGKISAGFFVSETARNLAGEIFTRREAGEDNSVFALIQDREQDQASQLASSLVVYSSGPPPTQEVVDDCIRQIARQRKWEALTDLQERFKRGELSRNDPEYQEFLVLQRERNA